MLPDDDVGRSDKPFRVRFPGKHFSGVSTGFGRQNVEKCFPWKRTLKGLSESGFKWYVTTNAKIWVENSLKGNELESILGA